MIQYASVDIDLDNNLFMAKPVSDPVLNYCGQISLKYELKYKNFHWENYIWKYLLQYDGHFVSVC